MPERFCPNDAVVGTRRGAFWKVNVEVDVIAKYVEKLVAGKVA